MVYDFQTDVEGLRPYRLRLDLAKLEMASAHVRVAVISMVMPVTRARRNLIDLRSRHQKENDFTEKKLLADELACREVEFRELYRLVAEYELRC